MKRISTVGPKSCGGVGWGGPVQLSQTSPIPRSPDGDNNIGDVGDDVDIVNVGDMMTLVMLVMMLTLLMLVMMLTLVMLIFSMVV